MEALASLLAARLAAALPFLDRITGLARLYAFTSEEDGILKLPLPVAFTAEECERDKYYLVPDKSTVGTAFFEDGGTVPFANSQLPPSLGVKVTSLRLLMWVNPDRLDGPLSEPVLLAAVEKALSVNRRYSEGEFVDVLTTYTLLPAETSLYGRYSFANQTLLLLPPYRLMGLDLKVQYQLARICVTTPLPGAKEAAVC